eukprot:CAMPEP_0115047886 /NCGR_PEP_ID=MMETSP0227-20121206/230_1 /TAXON_ID=89957 /ORGANISM="Polarella glacialis, Strain CCMP 1383" /LENGTH=38 /DNA_ID= /DNA_START= /DNA_END= /DNA_ORIENTATION=
MLERSSIASRDCPSSVRDSMRDMSNPLAAKAAAVICCA